jgi:hypothetical protein
MAKNESLKPSYWAGLCGDILKEFRCRVVDVKQTRSAHVKMTIKHLPTGKTRLMGASLTPSDGRVHKQRRTECRKLCRELASADN